MFSGLDTVVANLGLPFVDIITIGVICGSLIFFAKDFKLGVVIGLFFISGLCLMWFYYNSWTYTRMLYLFLFSLVLMALTFYTMGKSTNMGAVI